MIIQLPFAAFLTIGIPSVQRKSNYGMDYLMTTVASLLQHTTPEDRKNLVILIFLADLDHKYNLQVLTRLNETYLQQIQEGLIQIMMVPPHAYPELQNLKRNFNDVPLRVTWRSKQNIDFALMFLQGANISDYYMQIEDDVTAADGFYRTITDFIHKMEANHTQWAVLSFSSLGFIGKLMRSRDLEKFASFLLAFYDEQPVDWLLNHFEHAMGQKKSIFHRPSVFQHNGDVSSLAIKPKRHVIDKFFPRAPVPKHVKGNRKVK